MAAGLGWLALASGVIALTTLILAEKSRLHDFAARIDDEEMRAAARRFGVMAVVILPLLPEGPVGPLGGIRPRELWMLVLFFTGISFAGYLAQRMFGAGRGYPVAGLLAGVVSSTNATFTFARLSRREPALSAPLAVGTVATCTVLFPRVFVAACVLNWDVARALVPYLAAPFAIGLIAVLTWWRRSGEAGDGAALPANPLQIGPALQMAAVFQVVLFAVAGMHRLFGEGGLMASAAVLGLSDRRRAHDFHGAHGGCGCRGECGRQGHCHRHPVELCPQDRTGSVARNGTLHPPGRRRPGSHGRRHRRYHRPALVTRVDGRGQVLYFNMSRMLKYKT